MDFDFDDAPEVEVPNGLKVLGFRSDAIAGLPLQELSELIDSVYRTHQINTHPDSIEGFEDLSAEYSDGMQQLDDRKNVLPQLRRQFAAEEPFRMIQHKLTSEAFEVSTVLGCAFDSLAHSLLDSSGVQSRASLFRGIGCEVRLMDLESAINSFQGGQSLWELFLMNYRSDSEQERKTSGPMLTHLSRKFTTSVYLDARGSVTRAGSSRAGGFACGCIVHENIIPMLRELGLARPAVEGGVREGDMRYDAHSLNLEQFAHFMPFISSRIDGPYRNPNDLRFLVTCTESADQGPRFRIEGVVMKVVWDHPSGTGRTTRRTPDV